MRRAWTMILTGLLALTALVAIMRTRSVDHRAIVMEIRSAGAGADDITDPLVGGRHDLVLVLGERPTPATDWARLREVLREGAVGFCTMLVEIRSPHTPLAEFHSLPGADRIQTLVLVGPEITDSWLLSVVARCTRLESLELIRTNATSAGLTNVARVTALKRLRIEGSGIDARTLKTIREEHPNLNVDAESGR